MNHSIDYRILFNNSSNGAFLVVVTTLKCIIRMPSSSKTAQYDEINMCNEISSRFILYWGNQLSENNIRTLVSDLSNSHCSIVSSIYHVLAFATNLQSWKRQRINSDIALSEAFTISLSTRLAQYVKVTLDHMDIIKVYCYFLSKPL